MRSPMLFLTSASLQSKIYTTISVFLIIWSAGVSIAQPPPAGSGHTGQSSGNAVLPPEFKKINDQFALANKLYADKQYPAALRAYQEFIRLAIAAKLNSIAISQAYTRIAYIYHAANDNTGYADTLKKIVKLDPKNAAALSQLALAQSLNHDFAEAERNANRALALKSSNEVGSTAHFVKGNVAVSRKDFVAAAKEFAASARLTPSNTMAHFNGGLALAENKNYTDALRELESAHKLEPKNTRVNEYLTKLKTYMAELKAHPEIPSVTTKYTDILKKDPHNPIALLGNARQLVQMHRLKEAEAAYIAAVLANQDSFEAHFEGAHVFLEDQKWVQAKENYTTAQKLAAKSGNTVNSAKAFGGLADAEMQEGVNQSDYRQKTNALTVAENHVKQAIDINPKEADFKILLGRIYNYQSRFKEEGDLYREMIAAAPDTVSLYARLANTYKAVHDVAGYVSVWKMYQTRKPDDPTSYEYITEMYNQVGNYQEAANTLKDMLGRKQLTNSIVANASIILGQDYEQLKREDDARSEFKKVLEMSPSKVPAQYILGEKSALDTAQRGALKALADQAARLAKYDDAIGYLGELKQREAVIYRDANQFPDGEVYKNTATLYERSNRADKAMAEYSAMAKDIPIDPVPHEEMGRLLENKKEIDAAAREYKIGAKLNKKDPVQDEMKIADMYQRNDKQDKALAELEALRKDYPTKVEVLTALALIYRRTNQDAKALEIYDAIIKTNPSQGWVQDARAVCMVNLHRYKDAVTVYIEEITRNPRAGRQTYADLARVYTLDGHPEQFMELLKPRFERDPSNATLMAVIYDDYEEKKKETDGQAYISGVIEKSGFVRRVCLKAYANILELHKHNAGSLDIYRRIAKENPKDISDWMSLADELDHNNLHDEANQIYIDQIARNDIQQADRFSLQYKLATRYFQQNKLKEARAAFQGMFDHNNANFDVAMRLGDLIEKTDGGSTDEAITFYTRLLDIKTYIPQVRLDIRNRLGNLYELSNKKDDAVMQYKEALKLAPDDAIANAHLKKLQPGLTPAQ